MKFMMTVLAMAAGAIALNLAAQNVPTAAQEPAALQSVAGLDTSRMLRKHLERQKELEKAGILFAAGPVTGGDAPYGMIVVRADSREAAQKIADGDPLHAAKMRSYVLREWQINEGRVSVKLNFSDGTYQFD